MKVGFASDHAGFKLKEHLMAWAGQQGYGTVDFGTDSEDSVDYPDFAHRAAANCASWDFLVLVCGSGIGMCIAANRHSCIRCAVVASNEHALMARKHNNANCIAMGQRFTGHPQAESYLKLFLETEFEGGRHQKRVEKIDQW